MSWTHPMSPDRSLERPSTACVRECVRACGSIWWFVLLLSRYCISGKCPSRLSISFPSSECISSYLDLVVAGLAGSPQMISATIIAISRVLYEFRGEADSRWVPQCHMTNAFTSTVHVKATRAPALLGRRWKTLQPQFCWNASFTGLSWIHPGFWGRLSTHPSLSAYPNPNPAPTETLNLTLGAPPETLIDPSSLPPSLFSDHCVVE